jgi:hypothetical protein
LHWAQGYQFILYLRLSGVEGGMDSPIDLREDWRLLLKYLPPKYDALAHE